MDKEIIQNIIQGNEESFKKLYDMHIHKALRTATAITKNKELAKDATQEAFIRVYLNISSFDTEKPFEPWFYRILINECMRILKRDSRLKLSHDPLSENQLVVKDNPDFSHIYEALDSLKDIYRIPIILKYLNGFSEKEIAQALDLNINTVKSRLFQGRQKLKKALESKN
ncbi:MAG: sigma-70 family RNA polymerase sigma factor [Tissierellia bacterium]|nr:sigma-70 family RNA polymerase sigma factor [Tissierellia bacterium]